MGDPSQSHERPPKELTRSVSQCSAHSTAAEAGNAGFTGESGSSLQRQRLHRSHLPGAFPLVQLVGMQRLTCLDLLMLEDSVFIAA
jgi:hypothetical protein